MSEVNLGFDSDLWGFVTPGPDMGDELKPYKFDNPLQAFFEEIMPPYEARPKGQIYPEVPQSSQAWYPAMGLKGARMSSFFPKPFPGEPVTEAYITIPKGIEGKNSFINVIVDVSGSMAAPCASWKGMSFSRADIARIMTGLLVAMARITDSKFCVFGFGSGGYVEWKDSPSYQHEECIDWLTTWTDPYVDPLTNSYDMSSITPLDPRDGSTNLDQGLRVCIDTLKGINVDEAVTVMITDVGADSGARMIKSQCLGVKYGDTGKSLDEVLREVGPVFYIFVESAGREDRLKRACKEANDIIDTHYKKKIMYGDLQSVFYAALDANDASDTLDLASDILKIGKMAKSN